MTGRNTSERFDQVRDLHNLYDEVKTKVVVFNRLYINCATDGTKANKRELCATERRNCKIVYIFQIEREDL